jgi:two-component system response regulator HydG
MTSLKNISLAQVVDTMAEGVFVVDSSHRIVLWNKAMELLTGYPQAEVLGKDCSMLQCGGLNGARANGHSCPLFDREETASERLECLLRDRGGEQIPILKSASVLKDANGTTIGLVESVTDLRPLRYLEQQVEEIGEASVPVRRMGRLVGSSHRMHAVYERMHLAANSHTTVLILGETGTGKELVAEAVHFASSRKQGPLVKVNCSALSENLLESELFGHVKGAFTGAIKDKVGRFEAAHGGTILLDEIGDISPLIQLKLLRVLQEKEIGTCAVWFGRGNSGRISITACGSSRLTCRPCASTRRISPCWWTALWSDSIARPANRSIPSAVRSDNASWITAGPAMCGSWRTPSSMPT